MYDSDANIAQELRTLAARWPSHVASALADPPLVVNSAGGAFALREVPTTLVWRTMCETVTSANDQNHSIEKDARGGVHY